MYGVVKGLHILSVIAFMAGLLYLPRLFAYHSRAAVGSEMDETFQTMEVKLSRIIIGPASIAVLVFGVWLVSIDGAGILKQPWMMTKLAFVAFLYVWQAYLSRARKAFARGDRPRSERFWRMTNELPFLAAVVIVLSVTTKWGA